MIENNRKEEGIHESLEDNIGKVLLKDNKRILKLIEKKDIGGYLQGVRRYGLKSSTKT